MKIWLFPELSRFDPGSQRFAAWNAAYNDAFRGRLRWMCLAFALAAVWVIGISMFVPWPHVDPLSTLGLCLKAARAGLGALVGLMIVVYWARKVMQKNLRRQLNQMGRRTCVPCGYNLTGNASGVCPECGEPCSPNPD